MAFNEDSSVSGHDDPWISWFCQLKGHEMFCEVERSYIEDGFNLYGLRACVSNFSDCLDLILDRIGPDDDSDDSHLTQSACTLYGLIHARYIITAHGLDAMYGKYAAKEFGICPLVQCSGQPVLPVSLKDEMGSDTVKIFCPKCSQVYQPPPARSRMGNAAGVDGAAFGTTFPHLFLMTFSNLVPDPLPADSTYIPRVFGFRVHKSARQRFSSPPLVEQQQQQQQQQAATASANTTTTAATRNTTVASTTADKKSAEDDDDSKSPPAAADATATAASGNNNNGRGVSNFTTSSVAPTTVAAASGAPPPAEDKRPRSSSKRRKDAPEASASSSKNGSVGPTFLMENPVKRRRRTNNGT